VWIINGIINMNGGMIQQNTAGYGGGVYFYVGNQITLGGSAVIKGNTLTGSTTPSNLYIDGNYFIILGDVDNGVPVPVPGVMEIWVQTYDPDGLIVENAQKGDEEYFISDIEGKEIIYYFDEHGNYDGVGMLFIQNLNNIDNPFMVDRNNLIHVGRAGENSYLHRFWTLSAHYKLTENINRDPTNSGDPNWTPIGAHDRRFTGTFNGNGYTISNMVINSGDDYVGMFSSIGEGGKVSNLGLINVIIMGGEVVGGIAGSNQGGAIENCFVTGSVSGAGRVGGLAGMSYGNVMGSYFAGNVTGSDSVGSIVGENGGQIHFCTAISQSVIALEQNWNIGRIEGINYGGSLLSNYAWSNLNIRYSVLYGGNNKTPINNANDIDGQGYSADNFKMTDGSWNLLDSSWEGAESWVWTPDNMPRLYNSVNIPHPWPAYFN